MNYFDFYKALLIFISNANHKAILFIGAKWVDLL